jgi:hypothetical protein
VTLLQTNEHIKKVDTLHLRLSAYLKSVSESESNMSTPTTRVTQITTSLQ